MANPWLKKNPFMSVWLSGANAVAAPARAQVSQAQRQAAAAMTKATTDIFTAWLSGSLMAPKARSRRRR